MEASTAELSLLAPKFTRNKIPGADVLGFGFNIFAEYSTASLLGSIFQNNAAPALQWINPAALTMFDVPANVAVFNDTTVDGSVYVFSNQQEFQQHLAFKAGVKASASSFAGTYRGAFSASMSAGVSTTGTHSFWYALYEANYRAFRIALIDQSPAQLSAAFTSDADVLALPSTFSAANQNLFFRVFAKYGTHYVAEVELGGFLYYCASVERSYADSKAEVAASLSTEFSAVFAQAEADAEVEWESLSKEWYDSRTVQISAAGGDTAPLLATDPIQGENNHDVFLQWSKSVMLNPSVMNFRLRPLSAVYAGDQASAIDQAIAAYTQAYIVATSICEYQINPTAAYNTNFITGSSITLNGVPIQPDPMPTRPTNPAEPSGIKPPVAGFQVAAFDQDSLAVLLNDIYWVATPATDYATVYAAMLAAVTAIKQTGFLFVITGFALAPQYFPPLDLALFLRSCGASLDAWRAMIGYSTGTYMFNYVMIGKQGMRPGTASEFLKSYPAHAVPASGDRIDISETIGLFPPSDATGYRLTMPQVSS